MDAYRNLETHKNIIFISLVGFLIRWWMATNIPLTFDEAHNVLLARSSIFPLKIAVSNAYPPLYFTIWHLWQKISEALIWNLLLALVMEATSIAVTYFTLKKTVSRQVANFAAFLTAVTPGHVYYSAVARMYAPGILLATLFCI